MKKTLLMAGVASVLFAFNANAVEINPYASAKLKLVNMSPDLTMAGVKLSEDDINPAVSFALGASFKTDIGGIRTELEYNKNADFEKTLLGAIDTTVKSQSLLLNAYYDIDTGSGITPYIGAGLGYAKVKGKMSVAGISDSMDDNTFTWQAGAGVSLAATKNVSLDAGYRYVDYGTVEEGVSELDVTAHEFYIGARYTF